MALKVTVAEILERIPKLPTDVHDLVKIEAHGKARVESFRPGNLDVNGEVKIYPVGLTPHKDDPGDRSVLDAFCGCPSVKLCQHIVAFYAVGKGLVSPVDPAPEPLPKEGETLDAPLSTRGEGLKLIAQAIQKSGEAFQDLADGIALITKEVADEG